MIRNDLCLMPNRVIIIGTSTGYENAKLGPTHHVIDDIQILSSFHNLAIYSPTGKYTAIQAIRKSLSNKHASYIRICKSQIEDKPYTTNRLNYFGADPFLDTSIRIVCTGMGLTVLDSLKKENKTVSLIPIVEMNPIEESTIQAFAKLKEVYVWDDSSCQQLYKQLSYHLMIANISIKLISIAPKQIYHHLSSGQEEIYNEIGIGANIVSELIGQ